MSVIPNPDSQTWKLIYVNIVSNKKRKKKSEKTTPKVKSRKKIN